MRSESGIFFRPPLSISKKAVRFFGFFSWPMTRPESLRLTCRYQSPRCAFIVARPYYFPVRRLSIKSIEFVWSIEAGDNSPRIDPFPQILRILFLCSESVIYSTFMLWILIVLCRSSIFCAFHRFYLCSLKTRCMFAVSKWNNVLLSLCNTRQPEHKYAIYNKREC